jgi:hypothetical protein
LNQRNNLVDQFSSQFFVRTKAFASSLKRLRHVASGNVLEALKICGDDALAADSAPSQTLKAATQRIVSTSRAFQFL